jgi:NAD(P)-dependent dehydrogenase (short-subunit alcohol dehydrogenase family)
LAEARRTYEVNVVASLQLMSAVIPAMTERGEGWIVNVSSGSARVSDGPPFQGSAMATTIGVYGASKAALNRLTNALAVEVYGTGVRVNTVEPRAAVHSVGADVHLGDSLPDSMYESMEKMVEGTVALCDCGPDHTGRIDVSLDVVAQLGLEVMGLDGQPR